MTSRVCSRCPTFSDSPGLSFSFHFARLRARIYPRPASPANHLHARACGRQAMRTRPERSARAQQALVSAISLAFDACHQHPTKFSHRRASQSQRLSGSPARRAIGPPRSPTRAAGRLSGFALESSAVETIPAPLSDARRTRSATRLPVERKAPFNAGLCTCISELHGLQICASGITARAKGGGMGGGGSRE
ncbi:hypothetical protein VTO73DRAFT_4348 [Trametes versicolor]